MTAVHEFKCNYCSKREKANYNGEHWLMPDGWAQMYDDKSARTIDVHVCAKCLPKRKTNPTKGGE